MKNFKKSSLYESSFITNIKRYRNYKDRNKKDFSPTRLNLGTIELIIPRHFGFCFGVENALEIIHKAIEENPNRKIYLLSEIIHNPLVNEDLKAKGIKFIFNTEGIQNIDWAELNKNDVIVIPAFGTTLEIENKINQLELSKYVYDTTCPFVVKVWSKAEVLGKQGYTIVVHGKYNHEETRATFSHSKQYAPTIIIRDIEEVKVLCDFILNENFNDKSGLEKFYKYFENKYSEGFDPIKHLTKLAVVNQTTMLATETKEISEYIKATLIKKYGEDNINKHFADTRDTLCYATHHNQKSIIEVLKSDADFAIVIGGYNSSNTTHIVKLCEKKLPTYFISSEKNLISKTIIKHFDIHKAVEIETHNFIPNKERLKIILTSGASCPDSLINKVLERLLSFFPNIKFSDNIENMLI